MKITTTFLIILVFCITFFSCQDTAETKKDNEVNVIATSQTATDFYTEKHRPQFHFSPPAKWMNDPNGMVYYEGEYHLFYQHYPDSTVWGPMHWGHAVSSDMINWEHLPIGLYPDELGYIFSGSAVVDHNNTSGFGKDGAPPMIAIFTHHEPEGARDESNKTFQYQSIAYSNDKGRSWTKYEGNPVVPNPGIRDFRDPKVSWHEASNQWVMVFAAWDQVKFYGSPDLKKWTHLSDFGKTHGSHGGVWECPDLFPLQVEGTNETKYVLLVSINPGAPNGGSGTQYFVGDFDGRSFVLDENFSGQVQNENGVWIDYGRDNYAGVTWSDIPETDGRRLFLGWMSNWHYAQVVPTDTWRSAMTLPRVLSLKKTDRGYQLFTQMAKEVEQLRNQSATLAAGEISADMDLTEKLSAAEGLRELTLTLNLPKGEKTKVGVELS
ncbi:MAG: glycoside hydrolase family 32 protein, partial [Bacteroidota bacterium]